MIFVILYFQLINLLASILLFLSIAFFIDFKSGLILYKYRKIVKAQTLSYILIKTKKILNFIKLTIQTIIQKQLEYNNGII